MGVPSAVASSNPSASISAPPEKGGLKICYPEQHPDPARITAHKFILFGEPGAHRDCSKTPRFRLGLSGNPAAIATTLQQLCIPNPAGTWMSEACTEGKNKTGGGGRKSAELCLTPQRVQRDFLFSSLWFVHP